MILVNSLVRLDATNGVYRIARVLGHVYDRGRDLVILYKYLEDKVSVVETSQISEKEVTLQDLKEFDLPLEMKYIMIGDYLKFKLGAKRKDRDIVDSLLNILKEEIYQIEILTTELKDWNKKAESLGSGHKISLKLVDNVLIELKNNDIISE